MADGQERRAAPETNANRSLRSLATIEPVNIPQSGGPGSFARASSASVVQPLSASIATDLRKYGMATFGKAADLQHETSLIEGQMAAQQGQSMEALEMGGDKWALEGYRLVEAQRLSSSLLTAQREEIATGSYEMTPDQYRAHFMKRAETLLGAADDPRTAELARAQLLKQMPTLVDDQLSQHMQWKEQQNFDTLTNSVDTISMDPTSAEALISFADGAEGSATAGLSQDRRREAVVSGVVKAFENGNPMAYAILSKDGRFKELPVAQQRAIQSARKSYEQRQRSEYNADYIKAESELMTLITDGSLEPAMAMEAYAELLSEHNMTISQQEAGSVYSTAKAGVHNKEVNRLKAEADAAKLAVKEAKEAAARGEKLDAAREKALEAASKQAAEKAEAARKGNIDRRTTNSLLVEEAELRGDRQTAVNLAIRALTRSESSGRSNAVRTNDDGRMFGGSMQMGQGRLDMYNAQHGTSHTVSGFKDLSEAQQRSVNEWQINSILDYIDAEGYASHIGTTINGVEVTRIGMVAVAHLGGFGKKNGKRVGGLDKFLSSNGAYNPNDGQGGKVGTSLTDYLKKFGTGEALSPQDAQRAATQRIQALRDGAAVSAYEQMQPLLDKADTDYRRTGDEATWRKERAAAREQFGIEQTMADAKHAVGVMRALREDTEANIKSAHDEERAVNVGMQSRKAEEDFEQAATSYESGDSTKEELNAAYLQLLSDRNDIMTAAELPFSAKEALAQYDAQRKRLVEAMEARLKYDEGQSQIDYAELSGTMDQLPNDLQQRSLEQARERAANDVQDAIASGGVEQAQAGALMNSSMLDYFAKTGTIDPDMKRVLNGFVAGGLVDDKGNPRPEYVEAAQQYRDLSLRNPSAADKWFDKEHRDSLDAVLSMAAGGPLDAAVRTVGVRSAQAPRLPTTEVFLTDPRIMADMNEATSDYLKREDVGVTQAISNRDADLQQVLNTTWFDRFGVTDEVNKTTYKHRLEKELGESHGRTPHVRASELVAAAGVRVTNHTPIIGGIAVTLPMDGPTAGEMFFGNRAADFTDQAAVINDVVMDFFRTDAFVEQYPFVDDTTFAEALPVWFPDWIRGADTGTPEDQAQTVLTGVRPFQTYYDAASGGLVVQFSLPAGGYSDTILLDTRAMGQAYMRAHTAAAAN